MLVADRNLVIHRANCLSNAMHAMTFQTTLSMYADDQGTTIERTSVKITLRMTMSRIKNAWQKS